MCEMQLNTHMCTYTNSIEIKEALETDHPHSMTLQIQYLKNKKIVIVIVKMCASIYFCPFTIERVRVPSEVLAALVVMDTYPSWMLEILARRPCKETR